MTLTTWHEPYVPCWQSRRRPSKRKLAVIATLRSPTILATPGLLKAVEHTNKHLVTAERSRAFMEPKQALSVPQQSKLQSGTVILPVTSGYSPGGAEAGTGRDQKSSPSIEFGLSAYGRKGPHKLEEAVCRESFGHMDPHWGNTRNSKGKPAPSR